MRGLPIRLRLTIAFAFAMAILLAGLGIAVYTSFEESLDDNVDRALRSRATDIAAVVNESGARLPSAERRRFIESEESFAQLLDRDGRVVDGSELADAHALISRQDIADAAGGTLTVERDDVIEEGDPARLFIVPVGDHVLVVGQETEDNAEALGTLRVLLLVGLPITLLLASLGAYALAGAALRPVAEALERERGFVADASHELRTPLAVLKTELELALREGRTEAELRSALESASEETDRLTRLADDLLVLARSDRGTLDLQVESAG
jgi:two-component system, OmpR family, sensor kinase